LTFDVVSLVERVLDEEEFSSGGSSSADKVRTYTYPSGRKKTSSAKKSHSLPDSSLLPLCCINNGQMGNSGGSSGGLGNLRENSRLCTTASRAGISTTGATRETSISGEWLLKRRITSKSDGDSPSVQDEFHFTDHPFHYPKCGISKGIIYNHTFQSSLNFKLF